MEMLKTAGSWVKQASGMTVDLLKVPATADPAPSRLSPPPPAAAPFVPPPSWSNAGVSWLKAGQVEDLSAAAVSACKRAGGPMGDALPELEPLPLMGSRNYRVDALQKVFFLWRNAADDEHRLVSALKPSPAQLAAFAHMPGGAQAAWAACTELLTALGSAGHPFLLPSAHAEPVGYVGQRVLAQLEPAPDSSLLP